MTLDQFRKSEKRQFGNDFEVMNRPIREFSLETAFIVCGVDNLNFPRIFTIKPYTVTQNAIVRTSGSMTVHDSLGHAAIGSGRANGLRFSGR